MAKIGIPISVGSMSMVSFKGSKLALEFDLTGTNRSQSGKGKNIVLASTGNFVELISEDGRTIKIGSNIIERA